MARRDFLVELDGFDERFELYFEDVDLCERARMQGSVLMDTRLYGHHAGGASSKQVGAKSFCVYRISRARYFRKRWHRWGSPAAILVAVLELVFRSLTLQPEGWATRARALRLTLREVAKPGSVQVLS
jgi:GT2 family glycosyltransferase